ncbi:anaerobic ribonucleoside-triphosphate reductase activating protein [Microbulbifer rhizosphaerae]|uniref:Anaerobic ribonucleoside-triphosphate reductase activating protein n=1 Tax=Microbulbifer rhizosphaerae TaxID=1562603 RepID=A0A7W4W9W4_9GAMM|nr:anaerobic ribonucleoside-triphosphate reductase activating protein [Microbulbifer rhizosphaerae]MBB3060331.1 anaerobic ribonucleoside-triphosphate reductase activating protein [Microbulbifer rhizosphaerae]
MPHLDIRLPIAGLTPLTTLDFPGHLACVVFTQGCPLRCGYCHNPQMIAPRRGESHEWQSILDFLESRRGLLEGVVFSGGEPTLHAGLPGAAAQVRAMGFKVALHTAGPYPGRLAALLPLLDWVGLDVKGHGADYDRICGRAGIWQRHSRSLKLLLDSGIDFECRTTVHWRDFSLADVERMALSLADCGVRRYVLQKARSEQCLEPVYCQSAPNTPAPNAMAQLVARLEPHFASLTLRE